MEEMPERGIRVAFIPIGQTRIELIEPLHNNSEVSKFLEAKGPGLHHIAFSTKDIDACLQHLKQQDAKLVYDKARMGAHQTKVNFIHPKSSGGVLMEIVE